MRIFTVMARCEPCGITVADACSDSLFDVQRVPCPSCHQPMTPVGAIRSRKADEVDEMVFNEFGHRRVPYRPGDLD